MPDPWHTVHPLPGIGIDHIGIVVDDVAPSVALLRDRGFLVSDPCPLEGEDGPLGQVSAHCVFANGYVEISAPIAGHDNHLVPYLAHGPGIRILALRSNDADQSHALYARRDLAMAPVRNAARVVALGGGEARARFRWFPVANILPGVLTALVEHRDPDIVFAPELIAHPNGSRRLHDILFGPAARALSDLPTTDCRDLPTALMSVNLDRPISGFSVSPLERPALITQTFSIRAIARSASPRWPRARPFQP